MSKEIGSDSVAAIPVHGLRPADLPGKPARHRDLPLGPRIETLSHVRQPVRRSTLADANERRDWRIHAALAQRLITQARTLYVDEELGLDLTNTVYALDSTTIALCLSVFPWAHFRTTKAAVKMHTLLDLRGNIPSFIHISDGKLHDVHALDMLLPDAGAIYVVDRGYVDFARLYVLHQAGAFFVTRAKSNIDAHRVYSAPTDRSTGIICDQTMYLDGFYDHARITPNFCGASASRTPSPARRWSSSPTTYRFRPPFICALYKSRWQVELFFKSIKQHRRIKQFYRASENPMKTSDLVCRLGLRPRRHRQEAPRPGRLALHFVTDPLGDPVRENAHTSSYLRETKTDATLRK